MPLACLLGQGYSSLTSILNSAPKIKPQHLCLIGVRSFEGGEAAFLKSMNVKVYFMEEVKQRGFETVLKEAVEYVSRGTIGYGITLDIDAIDPLEAPGVDVPEADGIKVKELKRGLQSVATDNRLIATEIVEFDPSHDKEQMTEKLIISFIEILASAK
jgi:arginase